MKRTKSNKLLYPNSLKMVKLLQTIIIGCAMLLIGCEKDYTTGGVTGFVKTIDKYAQFCEDISGVKVSIANCNAYTNSEGKYQIDNIPVGTHSLKFTKEGFSYDSCLLTITPGEIPVFNPNLNFLSEKPDVKVTGMNISVAQDKIILKGTLSQSYSIARFFVFINNTPEVSFKNFDLEGSDFFWWIYRDNSYGRLVDMTYNGEFENDIYLSGITNYISNNQTYLAVYIANPFDINKTGLISCWPVTKIDYN